MRLQKDTQTIKYKYKDLKTPNEQMPNDGLYLKDKRNIFKHFHIPCNVLL